MKRCYGFLRGLKLGFFRGLVKMMVLEMTE